MHVCGSSVGIWRCLYSLLCQMPTVRPVAPVYMALCSFEGYYPLCLLVAASYCSGFMTSSGLSPGVQVCMLYQVVPACNYNLYVWELYYDTLTQIITWGPVSEGRLDSNWYLFLVLSLHWHKFISRLAPPLSLHSRNRTHVTATKTAAQNRTLTSGPSENLHVCDGNRSQLCLFALCSTLMGDPWSSVCWFWCSSII